ncbi:MAG: carboxypeptidase-like regulatory domain-containing protein [Planctomycetota bacterium]
MGSMRGALLLTALLAVGVLVWVATMDRGPELEGDTAIPEHEPARALEGSSSPGGPALHGTGTASGARPSMGTSPPPPPVDPATLDPVRDIFGFVVDEGGQPIAGATVTASGYVWRSGLITAGGYYDATLVDETRSATDGSFRLRVRPGQVLGVMVRHAGYATTEISTVLGGAHLRIVLRPGLRLVFTLEAPDGGPAADVPVGIWRADRTTDGTWFRLHQETGPDGRVVFEGLPGGVEATLEPEPVREGWGRPGWLRLTLQDSGEQHHTARLPEGRTLRGRITDAATGEPIEGARVGMNWVLDGEVVSDADGAYVLPGWTANGIRDIQVVAKGYVRGAANVDDRSEIDFALRRGFAIEGRVVDESGGALANARIATVGSEHRGSEQAISLGDAVSAADGTFRIDGLDPTLAHTIQVRAVERASVLLDIDAGPSGQAVDVGDIELPRPVAIVGRVVDAEGRGYPGVSVKVDSKTTGRTSRRTGGGPAQTSYRGYREVLTDQRGWFRVSDLVPGPWEVKAAAAGAEPQTRTVVAPQPEGGPPLEIVLGRTRVVTITVLDPDGVPVVGAYVQDKARTSSQRTNERGAVEISLPRERAVEITVWPVERKDVRQLAPTEVPADVTELEIRLERAVLVRGTLRDEAGQPVRDAVVYAYRGEERVGMGVVDGDGSFAIDVKEPGEVELRWNGDYVMRGPSVGGRPLMAMAPTRAQPGDELALVARPVPTNRSLRVQVLAPDGSPLAARIGIGGGMKIIADRAVDESGVAVIDELPAIEVYVSAHMPKDITEPWLMPESVRLVPDGQSVTLQFRLGTWLDVTLTKGGRPVQANVRVHLSNGAGGQRATWHHGAVTDAQGHFRIAVDPAWRNTVVLNVSPTDPNHGSWIQRRDDATAGRVEVSLDE